MARVGWVAVRKDGGVGSGTASGTPPVELHWFRLSVFDDGWVEVPGFGRATAALRGSARKAYRIVVPAVAGTAAGIALSSWGSFDGGTASKVLWIIGLVLIVGSISVMSVRLFSLDLRKNARSWADAKDLQRLKAAGRLPARVPGTPLFRRARTAEEFASRLTNTTLVRAADVSGVIIRHLTGDALVQVDGPWQGDDLPHVVDVQLHSGAQIRYRSPDAMVATLLSRFGVTSF